MDYKKLMDVAVAAGETMLRSGAETYRVEDTMNHILSIGGLKTADSFVLATGIIATLSDKNVDTITVVRRIGSKETDLNRIYQVNTVSRNLCAGTITLEEAEEQLERINQETPYKSWMTNLATVGVCAFFAVILGGTVLDVFGAVLVGIMLTAILIFCQWRKMNSILKTAMAALTVAFATSFIKYFLFPGIDTDCVIISAIMPLVPGMAFTNAIRDILYGDYTSGGARILEAILVAVSVAAGVGCGISMANTLVKVIIGGVIW